MNKQERKPKARNVWTAEHDDAVRELAAAAQRVRESGTTKSRAELFQAVEVARTVGVGWTRIGDTLGIASGNAYRRYRRRPNSSGAGHVRTTFQEGSGNDGAEESDR